MSARNGRWKSAAEELLGIVNQPRPFKNMLVELLELVHRFLREKGKVTDQDMIEVFFALILLRHIYELTESENVAKLVEHPQISIMHISLDDSLAEYIC
ncbi:hypothetical protein CEXT_686531 [Caerostris extrusa]|uniref:Uncharacterized protein n=1 Tax=Caerostris extrusa TaxID=172846 RepID=A0AAV4VBS6_CAEEX|nr:hypothetical protein CEXT_686531 [Caerostris extrusa]